MTARAPRPLTGKAEAAAKLAAEKEAKHIADAPLRERYGIAGPYCGIAPGVLAGLTGEQAEEMHRLGATQGITAATQYAEQCLGLLEF